MLNHATSNSTGGFRHSPPTPPGQPPSFRPTLFQQVRDWTAFFVSITSLVTATYALRNTISGPAPILADLQETTVTIVRSDQFVKASAARPSIVLREESGKPTDFPLLILPVTLSNRAAPPNGISVRSIDSTFSISRTGRTVFQSDYMWYRLTTSSAEPDHSGNSDRLVFETISPVTPFDIAGGTTWSREILFIPRETWAALSWKKFQDGITRDCTEACSSALSIRVQLDNGQTLAVVCGFPIDKHVRAHVQGLDRMFFTTPTCTTRKQN